MAAVIASRDRKLHANPKGLGAGRHRQLTLALCVVGDQNAFLEYNMARGGAADNIFGGLGGGEYLDNGSVKDLYLATDIVLSLSDSITGLGCKWLSFPC